MLLPVFMAVMLGLLLIAFAAILGSGIAAVLSAAPFYPTPPRVIRMALAEAKAKKGSIVIDLGAGTGDVILIAEREFGAKATGYEISVLFYAIAKLKIWMKKSRAKIRYQSVFKADVSDADIIFCFLTGEALIRIREKLAREARPGTRVISYLFRLHGWDAVKTIPCAPRKSLYIYEVPGRP